MKELVLCYSAVLNAQSTTNVYYLLVCYMSKRFEAVIFELNIRKKFFRIEEHLNLSHSTFFIKKNTIFITLNPSRFGPTDDVYNIRRRGTVCLITVKKKQNYLLILVFEAVLKCGQMKKTQL